METTGYKPLDSILSKTKGIILYQEQYMEILSKVFGFDLKYANFVRKILSKKKKNDLKKLEPEIRKAGKDNGVPEDAIDYFWKSALASADYSFCLCLDQDSVVIHSLGYKRLRDLEVGDEVMALNAKTLKDEYVKVINIEESKKVPMATFRVGDLSVICSFDHKFMANDLIMRPMREIIKNGDMIRGIDGSYRLVTSYSKTYNNVKSIDITVDSEDHNFYCNDLVVSNSHAASYSVLSAQMVWLKFKFPQIFYLHCLRMTNDKPDPFSEICQINQELSDFNIELLPPDVVKSDIDFIKEGKDIRFGLGSIKGISSKSLEKLKDFIKEDKENKFAVFQAGKSAGINIGQLTALIYTGALDSVCFGTDRRLMALEGAWFYQLKDHEAAYCLRNGERYNFSVKECFDDIDNWKTAEGKKVARKTRRNTINKTLDPYRQIYSANKNGKKFAIWRFEKALLGYAYTYSLLDVFECGKGNVTDITYARNQYDGDNIKIIGEVGEVKKWIAQGTGNECLKLEIVDEHASIFGIMVGAGKIELLKEQDLIPTEGQIIVIEGQKGDSEDTFWIEKISIQDIPVLLKRAELAKFLKVQKEEVQKEEV